MQLRQVRDIEYQLLPGSDRQTTDIVIERDGVITVRPPKRMTPEQVDETVLSKRMWIYRNPAEWRDLNATRVTREWVSGDIPHFGSCYRLQLVAEQDEPLKLKDGRFCLMRDVVARGGQEAAHRAFEEFYKAKGITTTSETSRLFASKVGVSAGDIQVRGWATGGRRVQKRRFAIPLEVPHGPADHHRLYRCPLSCATCTTETTQRRSGTGGQGASELPGAQRVAQSSRR